MKKRRQQQKETITNVKSCYVKLTIKKDYKKRYNRIRIKINKRDCCSSR